MRLASAVGPERAGTSPARSKGPPTVERVRRSARGLTGYPRLSLAAGKA